MQAADRGSDGGGERARQVRYPPDVIGNAPLAVQSRWMALKDYRRRP